ncbi:fibrinogen-like protein A [Apostichopus japonicus]|uniref:Fibrinogen-like protein A n=1 Tax=Stichopus japonicus TaxID=307972 RepID=A0A2G8KV81_STIJA|nr:fibrinogen-like protein A [Apostichopus japonicus]
MKIKSNKNDLGPSEKISRNRQRRETESSSYFYYQEHQYPRDCKEVYEQCDDQSESGVFMIQPDGAPEPFNVHCNNSIDGGGWTVFQRRIDGAVDFYRRWDDYKNGFGFLQREFWLGNDKLSYITNQGDYELRIDLVSRNGNSYFAKYDLFRISDEISKYRMTDLGSYLPESTANHANLGTYNRNMSFSTWDRDNDKHSSYNCASYYHGGWWFNNCYEYSHIKGLYFDRQDSYKTIQWYQLPGGRYNVKYTEMKLRPRTVN